MAEPISAGAIVGLLADADRRRCLAALELGAATRDEVVAVTGLTVTQAAKALGRLVSGRLVTTGSDGGLRIDGEAFQIAARDALSLAPSTEHDDQPEDVRKVLRNFVIGGRITQIPTSSGKRRLLLDWIVQDFEPGHRYTEQMVNLILGRRHHDTASLRRYLVDEGLLDRERSEYWRSGGTTTA